MTQSWKERPYDQATETQHLNFGRDPLLSRLLAQRKIDTGDADLFFSPQLDYVNWEEALPGSKAAAKMLLDVSKKPGARVAVIGDYDVDGVTSTAMLKILCDELGVSCHAFLPSRHEHGYGLNAKTVPAFIQSVGEPPDLLIAADCGTSSEPEVEKLRKFGAKRIAIIDHHIEDPVRFSASADLIVNWRMGKAVERQEMCTAGEIFVLAKILERLTDLKLTKELLPLAAIGTVADISPIIGLNRIIVKCGLARVGQTKIPGLRLLLEKCGLDEHGISQADVSFKLAPRLNAPGRMGRPNPSYDLLVERDEVRAAELVAELESCNTERKLILNKITDEAEAMAKDRDFKNGILLVNPDWHVGIVGVVASRVAERFFLPTIIMGRVGETIKGSGRSLEGVNLKGIMDQCGAEIFSAYGGHEMAAGATLKDGVPWENAAKIWDQACGKYFETHPRPSTDVSYDAEIPASRISAKLCLMLRETMYPYHEGVNPEPVFLVKNVEISRIKMYEGETWKLMSFEGRASGVTIPLSFKSFNPDHHKILEGQVVDVLFTCAQSWDQRYGPGLNVVSLNVVDNGVDWARP